MERVYHCIDCGKDFIIDSKTNTHAKRCPECRKIHRRNYLTEQKRILRASDKEYARRMKLSWDKQKFFEDPILLYKKRMLYHAKRSAKRNNVPFNLTLDDIIIPEKCPILGIDIVLKEPGTVTNGDNIANYNSPSLDRIIPERGYIRGNVWVISYRANTAKNNLSFDEIEKIYNAMIKLKQNNFIVEN